MPRRTRLVDVWPFGKPKTPGFGIAKTTYLSVLAASASLPSPEQVAHPKGGDGRVVGFLAPLSKGSTKEDLARPMGRGLYAVASRDQKTVLKLTVIPKEEVGFDPEAAVLSLGSRMGEPDIVQAVRATWSLLQLTFEAHDPLVYPSLDFFLSVAARLGSLTGGVVADPIAQVYKRPEELLTDRPAAVPVWAPDVTHVHIRATSAGSSQYLLGLQKFGMPELEMSGITPDDQELGAMFLYGVAQSCLLGAKYKPGDNLGHPDCPAQVAVGGLDRAHWEGIPCLELLPPTGRTLHDVLAEAAKLSS